MENEISSNNTNLIVKILVILIVFFTWPIGMIVIWFLKNFSLKEKLLFSIIPTSIIALIVLSLPTVTPMIEKRLKPQQDYTQKCILSCNLNLENNPTDIYDPCVLECLQKYIK